jgi:SHS2 domain-containing protein
VRVEAWAHTREECVAQAIQGMVASFAQVADGTATAARECPVQASNDDDLLLAALEEVLYLLDTAGELPATVAVRSTGPGWLLELHVADAAAVELVGAVPKAVSRHELWVRQHAEGWMCSALLDV